MSIIHLEKENFDELIKEGKVLVDFYAEWCGPCKMLAPILEDVSNERNNIKIIKINTDEFPDLAQKYGIMSIPTLILFDNGKEINKNIGFISKDEVISFINEDAM